MFGLFNLGGGEIILILALVLILFGAKKLPELAKGLGTGIKEFKKATRDVTDEMHSAMEEHAAAAQAFALLHHACPARTDRPAIHSGEQGLIRTRLLPWPMNPERIR